MIATNFKELIVWQKGMQLVKVVYKITNTLPKEETYVLTSQILRAAISIPSNIAEGFKRNGHAEFKQFLKIADASAAETETQFLIIQDIYPTVHVATALNLVIEIQKIFTKLISGIH
jgi:four helix bundle protein